jgi:hypothetical protein
MVRSTDGNTYRYGATRVSHVVSVDPVRDHRGVNGIKRWLSLSDEHYRAVGPLTARHRISRHSPAESRLLDLCTGIEYWVNFHANKKRAWQKHLAAGMFSQNA